MKTLLVILALAFFHCDVLALTKVFYEGRAEPVIKGDLKRITATHFSGKRSSIKALFFVEDEEYIAVDYKNIQSIEFVDPEIDASERVLKNLTLKVKTRKGTEFVSKYQRVSKMVFVNPDDPEEPQIEVAMVGASSGKPVVRIEMEPDATKGDSTPEEAPKGEK